MSFSNLYSNTCVQLHNLHLFTEEDGTTINNEVKKEL